MSHKEAPAETSSQAECRQWWTNAQPHIKRAWGRGKDGSFLAEESRQLHAAWLAAQPRAVPDAWRPMDTAPRDGTMLRLLVQFDDHTTEDTTGPAPTIGAYEEGADGWQFAGWCWAHDHFTQGVGTPVGWLPMLSESRAVPDGWVMVPREPTPEMLAAGEASIRCDTNPAHRPQRPTAHRAARNTYVSMLAAAPQAGEPQS